MAHVQVFWYRLSRVKFVSNTMCQTRNTTCDTKLSVPVFVTRRSPFVAFSRSIYMLLETNSNGNISKLLIS